MCYPLAAFKQTHAILICANFRGYVITAARQLQNESRTRAVGRLPGLIEELRKGHNYLQPVWGQDAFGTIVALRGILQQKRKKKGSEQVLKIQRGISEMYFTQAHLKQSQHAKRIFLEKAEQKLRNKNLLILQFVLWATQLTAHNLCRSTRAACKSVKNTWGKKKKKKTSTETGPSLPGGSHSSIPEPRPRSQLKACAAREEDRAVLLSQKKELKELNQRTGLKQTKPKQKQLPKPLHQRSLSAADFPQSSNTRNRVLCRAVLVLTHPSIWAGQALALPRHRYQAHLSQRAIQGTPILKAGSATTLTATYSVDQAHKKCTVTVKAVAE